MSAVAAAEHQATVERLGADRKRAYRPSSSATGCTPTSASSSAFARATGAGTWRRGEPRPPGCSRRGSARSRTGGQGRVSGASV